MGRCPYNLSAFEYSSDFGVAVLNLELKPSEYLLYFLGIKFLFGSRFTDQIKVLGEHVDQSRFIQYYDSDTEGLTLNSLFSDNWLNYIIEIGVFRSG